jgi:hypothetical protein
MQSKGYIGCNSHPFHRLQCNNDVPSAYTQNDLVSFRSWLHSTQIWVTLVSNFRPCKTRQIEGLDHIGFMLLQIPILF